MTSLSDQAPQLIAASCALYPALPVCTLASFCDAAAAATAANSSLTLPSYCNPVSLVADLCAPGGSPTSNNGTLLPACTLHKSTCSTTTPNPLCTANTFLPALPAANQTATMIRTICNSMNMQGCSSCLSLLGNDTLMYPKESGCELLTIYGMLCTSMSSMGSCTRWASFCQAAPEYSKCANTGWKLAPISAFPSSTVSSSSSTSLSSTTTDPGTTPASSPPAYTDPALAPEMRMYFHTDMLNYILFASWVPRTYFQYAFAWIACFLLAIIYEMWTAFVAYVDARWLRPAVVPQGLKTTGPGKSGSVKRASAGLGFHTVLESGFWRGVLRPSWKASLVRGGLRFVSAVIVYVLMLLVMTFNVGIFFAIVLGLSVGSTLFGGGAAVYAKEGPAAAVDEVEFKELCC